MRITFTQPAADGTRLAPGALDSAVGREYPLDIKGQPTATGVIMSAWVLHGGERVRLTVEIPDDSPAARLLCEMGGGPGPFGISDDSTLYRPFEIRRRTPEDARAYLAAQNLPDDVKALIEEAIEP